MLYRLLRPLLFCLDAELAHRLGMSVARAIARRPRLAKWLRGKPEGKPVSIAGLEFPNRIGLAAGLDKNAEAPLAWWAFGFGFAELGTVTPLPQSGQPRPRLFRKVGDRALVNRMGFNNEGAEAIAARLASQVQQGLRPPTPLGISIGKNATTPDAEAENDYALAAKTLAPCADFITVNISSPNTPRLRDLQVAPRLTELLQSVRGAIGAKPLFVKLAPELEGDSLSSVLETCVVGGVNAIISVNTLATNDAQCGAGGLSGRPIHALALSRVAEVRRRLPDSVAVIGCGGVDSEESARAMLDAGAELIQLYTGLIYKGPFLPARLARSLARVGREEHGPA